MSIKSESVLITSDEDINDYSILVSNKAMEKLDLKENDKVMVLRYPMISIDNVIESLDVKKYGNKLCNSEFGSGIMTAISPSNYHKMCFDIGYDACIIRKL